MLSQAQAVLSLAPLLALSLIYGRAFLWLLVGLGAVIGVVLPAKQAFWSTMVLALLTLGRGVWLSSGLAEADWPHLVPLVMLVRGLGLDLAGLSQLGSVARAPCRAPRPGAQGAGGRAAAAVPRPA